MDQENNFITKIKNNKFISTLIGMAIILVTVLNFFDEIVSFYNKFIPNQPENNLDISISSFDPRFNTADEIINWGGGSQSIFIRCNNQPCKIFDDMNTNNYEYWEVAGFTDIQFLVTIVYNGTSIDPTCVINEWGVNLDIDTTTINDGNFFCYNNIGGSDAPLEGGECVITRSIGNFKIIKWYKDDFRVQPPQRIHYLKPNDLIPLKVTLKMDNNYKGIQNCISNTDKVKLRVYAKLRIGGKDKIVYSKESIRLIIVEPNDSVDWNLNKMDWNIMEDLRKKTIKK